MRFSHIHPRPARALPGILAIAGVLAAAALTGGCQYSETYNYVSKPFIPQTVTLVNTTTGETIWTCEVPAGQQLNIQFKFEPAQGQQLGYDEMQWTISGADTNQPTGRKNSMRVPPNTSRRLDVAYRPVPETSAPVLK